MRSLVLAGMLVVSAHVLAQESEAWKNHALPQRIADGARSVELAPYQGPIKSLGWSPKGTKFSLQKDGGSTDELLVLSGLFNLGEQAEVKVRLTIDRKAQENSKGDGDGDAAAGSLQVDGNGNGKFEPSESSQLNLSITRGKSWYTGEADLLLPESGNDNSPRTRRYPVSLWYVVDPSESEAEPVMRWSPAGWHAGEITVGGAEALLVVGDLNGDGLYTKGDRWGLVSAKATRLTSRDTFFGITSHAWLDETPYRMSSLDSYGRTAVIEAFDLGKTRAEEEAKKDRLAADRALPRAKKPVEFLGDFDKALEVAKQNDQLVFVDFVTTWCGPCKVMDELVYTAAPTAQACKQVVCLQLDGDEQKELVKRFEVAAFPTLLLLSADGEVVDRRTGYQSSKKLVSWIDSAVQAKAKGPQVKVEESTEGFVLTEKEVDSWEWIQGKKPELKQDQIFLIDLWATWCGPCIQAMPHLQELSEKYREKGVSVIALSQERDVQDVRDFVGKHDKFTFSVAHVGLESSWAESLGITAIPQTVILRGNEVLLVESPFAVTDKLLDVLLENGEEARSLADDWRSIDRTADIARAKTWAKEEKWMEQFDQAFASGNLKAFDEAVEELKGSGRNHELTAVGVRAVLTEDWKALEEFCKNPRGEIQFVIGRHLANKVVLESLPATTIRAIADGLGREISEKNHPVWVIYRARALWALGDKEQAEAVARKGLSHKWADESLETYWQGVVNGKIVPFEGLPL